MDRQRPRGRRLKKKADLVRGGPGLDAVPAYAEAPPTTLVWRPTLAGRLAAASTRGLVRIAQWKGRKRGRQDLAAAPSDQVFRGFIQINLIRPH